MKKLLKRSVIPTKFRVAVWLAVSVISIGIVYQKKITDLVSGEVFFSHLDQEAGVACSLDSLGKGVNWSCEKEAYLGLPLEIIDPTLKTWEYDTDSGVVVVEREGVSSGIRLRVLHPKVKDFKDFILTSE